MRIIRTIFRTLVFMFLIWLSVALLEFGEDYEVYLDLKLCGCERSFFTAVSYTLADPDSRWALLYVFSSVLILCITWKKSSNRISCAAKVIAVVLIMAITNTVGRSLFTEISNSYPATCYPVYGDSLWINKDNSMQIYPSGDGKTAYLQYQTDEKTETLKLSFLMGACYVKIQEGEEEYDFSQAMDIGEAEIWSGIFAPNRIVVWRNQKYRIPELDLIFGGNELMTFRRTQ